MHEMHDRGPTDAFTGLLKRLVRVPKREIDEQEEKYRETREYEEPAKPRQIIPARRSH